MDREEYEPGQWGIFDEINAFVAVCDSEEADAKLIAAAPEMHQLLRCFLAIDDLKVEASTYKIDELYMRALVEQDAAVKATRELLARIDDDASANE